MNYKKKNLKSRNYQGGKKLSKKKKIFPLISIITVVYNNRGHLQKTLNSIFAQKNKNYELIIIDGGSNDGTLNIIKKNNSKIDFWISEPDKGLYDAFNKGMKYSSGDYLGFVNSDDILLPNALQILSKYIKSYTNVDFFFGAVKKHWGILHGYRPWKIRFSWGFYSSHSTGFFIKSSAAKLVGKYNLKYKYSADYDYFYRMIVKKKLKGMGTKKEELFGIFRREGYSSKINFKYHFREEIQIRKDNGQSKLILLIIIIYKTLKNYKKIFFN